jgi:integrase
MARPIHKLTALGIKRTLRRGRYGDGGGLYLQVDGRSKSWLFRYKQRGRTRYLGLGPIDLVGVEAARERAQKCRKLLQAGIDPQADRDAERARLRLEAANHMTFDACTAAYLDAHLAGWRNPKHRQQWENTLRTYASPKFGSVSVRDVDTALVMRAIEPIWATKPETAGRLRGRIERILSWAKVRGHREGDNPARWKGHLDQLLPGRGKVRKVKHHAALPYTELTAFMSELRAQNGVAARALEFTILCAVRTGDVIGSDRDDAPPMRWSHVDLDAATWTIPKTKSGSEHKVPLPVAAVELLRVIDKHRLGEIVFPSPNNPSRPLSNGAMLTLLDRMGPHYASLTVHGFRATFKTWASERTNFAREVAEAALAHAISDQLEAAYRRGDFFEKRRRLMNAWADYSASPAWKSGKLISLPAARQ